MAWPGPILTDSGGFQVFSLADINKIDDDGVTFQEPHRRRDGELTPQRSMQVQNDLGADIIMAFDECPIRATRRGISASRRSSGRCGGRSNVSKAHARPDGSVAVRDRAGRDGSRRCARMCAEKLIAMDFPGYAIGGLAVGEGFEAMKRGAGVRRRRCCRRTSRDI